MVGSVTGLMRHEVNNLLSPMTSQLVSETNVITIIKLMHECDTFLKVAWVRIGLFSRYYFFNSPNKNVRWLFETVKSVLVWSRYCSWSSCGWFRTSGRRCLMCPTGGIRTLVAWARTPLGMPKTCPAVVEWILSRWWELKIKRLNLG